MTPLSAIFVDASEAERKRYTVCKGDFSANCNVLSWDAGKSIFNGTRAECERWVADRAAKAGHVAVRAVYLEGLLSGSWNLRAEELLEQLAGGE